MQPSFPQIDLSKTVCAIATPPGSGGLGIVRLSGPEAIPIAERLFRGKVRLSDQAGFTVHHGFVVDPKTGSEVDEVLVTLFRSPKSFTKEDLVEFSAHGGRVILQRISDILTDNGAIPAVAGEFTLRAFLNGRIDLTEAEAVADLISAKTEESAAAALRQLKGALLTEIQGLRQETRSALASLEMGIDFVEEDIGLNEREEVSRRLSQLAARIDRVLGGHQRGRILRHGFTVVLAGPPNVGKSTLFNRLANDERAIVTDIPGTTRDILREYINLSGWPVCIVDTAGLRESTDLIERIGIERTSEAVGGANAAIWMLDPLEDWQAQLPPKTLANTAIPQVICFNKSDRVSDIAPLLREAGEWLIANPITPNDIPIVRISAKTGQGVDALLKRVETWIADCGAERQAGGLAINDRHEVALKRARRAVAAAAQAVTANGELELIAFEVQNAATALGEIIGETTTEEVLGEIFANFCIGK
jgi:tRNA modification GTPase